MCWNSYEGQIMQRMKKTWLAAAWLAAASPVAYAQEEPPAEPDSQESETPLEDESDDGDVVREVLDTDDESYRDIDDEDFRPSEEIPADQSIAFPTDI